MRSRQILVIGFTGLSSGYDYGFGPMSSPLRSTKQRKEQTTFVIIYKTFLGPEKWRGVKF
jgi:hypothetical protein